MAIPITVSGASVVVLEGSAKYHDTIDLRKTLEFIVVDSTGTAVYQPGQPVVLNDTANNFSFTGWINDAKATNITPNTTNLIDVTCIGNEYLATRAFSKKDYANQYGGDIATDLTLNYLAQDGVKAAYAIRRDDDAAHFGQGTLSNVIGASNVGRGDLELAPAGSTVSLVENTTAVFGAGTLTNVTAANNTLSATAINTLKLTGAMNVPGISGAAAFMKIWTGSYTIGASDQLLYYVWVDPSSPEIKATVDVVCTDGTRLQDQNLSGGLTFADTNNIIPAPGSDLSGYANGQWYLRDIFIGQAPLTGKSIAYISVALGGQKTGNYTAYFRNIVIRNGSGNVSIFNNTLAIAPQQLETTGYQNVLLSQVNAYDLQTYQSVGIATSTISPVNGNALGTEQHTRVSTAYSVAAATLLKNSLISWQATEPTNTKLTIRCALDNGTPVECSNHAPLPNLVAGMNLAGRTLTIYQDFYFLSGAISPAATPTLSGLEITLESAPACTKTDTAYTTSFSGSEVGASFSSTIGNSSILNLTGATRNWDSPIGIIGYDLDQTTYLGAANDSIQQRAYGFGNPSAGNESKTRFDFAGTHQNFVVECDVQVVGDVSSGLVYRSTNLSANNGSYAYAAMLSSTTLVLKKGTNTTAGGAATTLTTVTFATALTANSWHRLKVVVSGSSHTVLVDDVQFIARTDSSFSATGYLGVIGVSPTVAYPTILFDNFGVMDALSGTWTSPNIPLNSVTSYGNSYIYWRDRSESPASNDTLLVQYTINGGSTWITCTNGAALPGLLSGQSLTSVNLQIRVTLSSTTAQTMPGIDNLYVLVTGAFSATGYRIAPSLPLTGVGTAGSTLASWNALVPANTALLVDTSIDNGVSWQNVGSGATGSAPIGNITTQGQLIDDTFVTNTLSSYTQAALNTPATWTPDTTNSRITATGGNNALLEYTGLSVADLDVMADLDQADNAGLVARVSGSTMYALIVYDASATTFSIHNAYFLYAIVAGSFTQLATGSITFVRGTPHRFHLSCVGNVITAVMDGVTLATVTNSSISGAGTAGLLAGSLGRFYQFRVQPFGQSVSSISVLTRQRLTSIDPTATPQVTDVTLSVHGPTIQNGGLIPKANYSVLSGSKNTIAADLDDLAKQSTDLLGNPFAWGIDSGKNLIFQSRNATPSPWIATGADILLKGSPNSSDPQVEGTADLYRNDQFVNGGSDVVALSKTFVGDGETQTWTLDYPVDSLTSVSINGVSSFLIGVKGVDTGKDFYYEVGSPVISQDASDLPLASNQAVIFSYNAQTAITVEMRNDAAISARAALDGTNGRVMEVEDGKGLNKLAMIQKCSGLLQTNSQTTPETITFTTMRGGFAAGQILTVWMPALNAMDWQGLITDISVEWHTTTANGVAVAQPFYAVTATSGPVVGGFERLMANIVQGVTA